jgi:hypothetical protein
MFNIVSFFLVGPLSDVALVQVIDNSGLRGTA